MKVHIEGEVSDLGGVELSEVKEIIIFLRTDIALVAREVKLGVLTFES